VTNTQTLKTDCTDCDTQDYLGPEEYICVGSEVYMHQYYEDYQCQDGACVLVFSDYIDTFVEDCWDKNGWYDVGDPYPCCDGNSACTCQDQEYRSYACSDGSCTYTVTNTQTLKTDCTDCDDGDSCTDDYCVDGVCYNDPIDCDHLDDWYEDGLPYNVCEGDGFCTYQDMVYLDYFCSDGECVPAETNWDTVRLGCESCDDGDPCTIDECVDGACVHTPYEFPCLDHFKGYNVTEMVTPGPLMEEVTLEDQFGVVTANVTPAQFFCNPVERWDVEGTKLLAPTFDYDHHLTLYGLEYEAGSQSWCVEVVEVDNQFGLGQQLAVDDPALLAVPSDKNFPGEHGPCIGLDHFLLYPVQGSPIDAEVWLVDINFDWPHVALVAEPVFFANPVNKTHDGLVTEIMNPDYHLVFYRIYGMMPGPYEVDFSNQFDDPSVSLWNTRLYWPCRPGR
jgi:hypothetical protein